MRAPRAQAAMLAAIAAALAGVAAAAAAQPARLLADVSDRPFDHPFRQLVPPSAVLLDGVVYFSHDDGATGHELWRSDGSEAGTWRVRDICPGRCWGMVQEITVAGGRLFFTADDGAHGAELWSSDGTAAGTRLVVDVAAGLAGSRPEWITALDDGVFFSADDRVQGREPWFSDGTAAGTERLADVRNGATGSSPSDAVALTGGVLFFADDGMHGSEPWVTDGTAAGTALVLDVRSGPAPSGGGGQKALRYPQSVPFAGRAWFAADDGVHGWELWSSDGTPAGTALAADLEPGGFGSSPNALTQASGRLYFRADTSSLGSELFSTDGITTGLVADLQPGRSSSRPLPIGALDDRLFFGATTEATGHEIWTSDGTAAGTELLADLAPGPANGAAGAWSWPALAIGGRLFFANGPDVFAVEPWISDGTAAGTHQVADLWPGPQGGLSVFFGTFAPPVALGDRLFFFAAHPDRGWEPWISDGTGPGTRIVRDVNDRPSSQIPLFFDLDTSAPIDAGGRLYFLAATWESAAEPWTSRGTPQSTHRVAETVPGPAGGAAWPVAPIGTRLVFSVHAGDHNELWVTDEDGSSAELLTEIEWTGGFGGSFAGRAFFEVAEGRRNHLWTSDGTPGGTGRLVDEPGFGGGFPAPFAQLGGRLYFLGDDRDLWSTDGTPAGTVRVRELDPATAELGGPLVASGERLYFPASSPDTDAELWTSDGSAQGTVPLPEVRPGAAPGFVDASVTGIPLNLTLVPVGDGVAFVGNDGIAGEEPWWSDGTGVARVADLRPGARGSEPRWLTATGGTLFFAAEDGAHGRELWRWRPGEAAARVTDLVPGSASSLPRELAGVDGQLYFAAFTPERGVELWRSDGTAAGTELVQDVWPGAESSTPSRLTASGRHLFFTADDGEHGREMWSLLLPTRRPRASLSAEGRLVANGRVVLTLRLDNPPPEELPDGESDELRLPLPPMLEPLEWTATSGSVAIEPSAPAAATAPAAGPLRAVATATGGALVTWNGSLAPGGSVDIVLVVRVRPGATVADVSLQATGAFDSDGDRTNDEPLTSDDPRLPGENDATVLAVAVDVPALTPTALAALAAALALLTLHRLRPAAG